MNDYIENIDEPRRVGSHLKECEVVADGVIVSKDLSYRERLEDWGENWEQLSNEKRYKIVDNRFRILFVQGYIDDYGIDKAIENIIFYINFNYDYIKEKHCTI